MRRRLLLSFLVASVSLRATVAFAQPTTGVDALVERGLQARADHRDAEALGIFRLAYDLEASPRVLAQVALAEQALGRWTDAERDLVEAMKSDRDAWIDKHHATLSRAVEVIRDQLSSVEVVCNQPHAELWVNGESVGALPLPSQRVAAGHVLVEVRAPGFEAFREAASLEPRQSLRIEPQLVAHATSGPGVGTAAATAAAGSQDHARTHGAAGRRTAAWTMLAVGGGLLAGAVVAHVAREMSISYFNDDQHCYFGTLSRAQRCGDVLGQAQVEGIVAIAAYAGAAAAFATSSYFFLTVQTHDLGSSTARWNAQAVAAWSF
jgi:hypothetical protein